MKRWHILIAMMCILFFLPSGVDGTRYSGLSVGDFVFLPEIQGKTFLVFLDLEHTNDFLPFLKEVAVKYQGQLSLLIVASGKEHEVEQKLASLPYIMDSSGQITRSFQQGLIPSFYLISPERKVLYKHTLFTISEWVAIESVLKNYIETGVVEDTMLEYNLEEGLAFPCELQLNKKGETLTSGDVRLLLLMEPYPQIKDVRNKGYVDFLKTISAKYNIRSILLLKSNYSIESSNYKLYMQKYALPYPPLPNRDSWWKKLTRWFYLKLLRVKTFLVIDPAWRRLGYPSTPTYILIDQQGIIRDVSCARCVQLADLENYYHKLIPTLQQ